MEHRDRIVVAMALLAAACSGQTASNNAAYNGRWNLTVPDNASGRAWWLEVNDAGTPRIHGRFVGAPGGGMYDIPEISIANGELVWIFPRTQPPGRLVYRATLDAGKLKGYMAAEGAQSQRQEFTGERAPVIADRNDGSWKPGVPVELFNGKDVSGWLPLIRGRAPGWTVGNGILTNSPGANNLVSERKFWNFTLHAEYRLGQRSNSGIGLRGRYEVQILDDFGAGAGSHGHGSIYSRIAPAVNASKRPGEWQTLDVTLIGRYVSVVLNGVQVIDNREIEGLTAMGHDPHEDQPGPISVQGDHEKVEIRKLTVTPLTR